MTAFLPKGDMFGTAIPASAEITKGECGDGVSWTIDGYDSDRLRIYGNGAMKDYQFTESPFYQNTSIKEIIIEEGVTHVGNVAFYGCTSLESVKLPYSLKSIGGDAFSHCTNLKEIYIPGNVTKIGDFAFSYAGLKEITIPGNVKTIGKSSFYKCSSLSSIKLLEGIESIGDGAFKDCTEIWGMRVPESVKTIGSEAIGYGSNTPNTTFAVWGKCESAAEYYAGSCGPTGKPYKIVFVSNEPYSALNGDVNGDLTIDIEDVVELMSYINGNRTFAWTASQRADANSDSTIDIEDAVTIVNHINGVKPIDPARFN